MSAQLRIAIHLLDTTAQRGAPAQLGSLMLPVLRVGPDWAAPMLPLTFEQAISRLTGLTRAHVEPDGSFCWVGSGPPEFHFEGQLHDRGQRLSHVEINGYGGPAEWLRLIEAAGGDLRSLMLQSVQHGTFFAATGEENHENTK